MYYRRPNSIVVTFSFRLKDKINGQHYGNYIKIHPKHDDVQSPQSLIPSRIQRSINHGSNRIQSNPDDQKAINSDSFPPTATSSILAEKNSTLRRTPLKIKGKNHSGTKQQANLNNKRQPTRKPIQHSVILALSRLAPASRSALGPFLRGARSALFARLRSTSASGPRSTP